MMILVNFNASFRVSLLTIKLVYGLLCLLLVLLRYYNGSLYFIMMFAFHVCISVFIIMLVPELVCLL